MNSKYAFVKCNLSHRASVAIFAGLLMLSPCIVHAQWAQYGGPNRDFSSSQTGISTTWPEDGPRKLWTRNLGDGYSAISVDGNVLYTMYGEGDLESVIAMDAGSGKTVWEHTYPANLFKRFDKNFGTGPRSTPLIVGDRVYTIGAAAMMYCLDQKTGKEIWSHDLIKEYDATKPRWGYSSSPIAYKDTIIVLVGGKDQSIIAFDKKKGSVVWSRHDFSNGYSSPILINVDGQEQLVALMGKEVVGLNPANGDLYWQHPHETNYDVNASMPIWGDDGILFISSAYDTGSRALKLTRSEEKTSVKELWFQPKMKLHFGSAIRIGEYVYGTSGGNGPVFFGAININTGKMAYRKRNVVAKAQLIYVDEKLIIMDEEGLLVIASVTPEDVTVLSKAQMLEKSSWTVPTLVDGTLYIRDRKTIMALDMSGSSG